MTLRVRAQEDLGDAPLGCGRRAPRAPEPDRQRDQARASERGGRGGAPRATASTFGFPSGTTGPASHAATSRRLFGRFERGATEAPGDRPRPLSRRPGGARPRRPRGPCERGAPGLHVHARAAAAPPALRTPSRRSRPRERPVLLVEDEPSLARGLVDYFRHAGYEVRHVRRGDAAFAAVRESRARPGGARHHAARALRPRRPARPSRGRHRGSGGDAHGQGRHRGSRASAWSWAPTTTCPSPSPCTSCWRACARCSGARAARPAPLPEALVLGGIRFDFRALTASGPAGPPTSLPTTSSCSGCWRRGAARSCRVSTSSRRSAASTPRPPCGPSTTTSSPCGARSATTPSGRASCTRCGARAIASAFPEA